MPDAATGIAAAATTLGLAAGGLWYASAWPTSQLFGRTLLAGPDPNQIALTFDDGPNPAATPHLLDLLARHRVQATFFAIGAYVRREPALARRILAEGHQLGNHTMHHPRLSIQPAARIRQELADANAALEDITGAPVRLFRPPFGARRPFVLRAARDLGLTPVLWNVTGRDWTLPGPEKLLATLTAGIARNRRAAHASNLLLHDGSHLTPTGDRRQTIAAVDRLLALHTATQTQFVTVGAWLPDPPSPVSSDASV